MPMDRNTIEDLAQKTTMRRLEDYFMLPIAKINCYTCLHNGLSILNTSHSSFSIV